MLFYIAKRILMTLLVLLLVIVFLALLVHIVPGDPATTILGPRATPGLIQKMRSAMDLDKPIYVQIGNFLLNIFHGSLGVDAITGAPITKLVGSALPNTLILAITSLGLAILFGIPMGVFSATHPNSWVDRILAIISISFTTIPSYVAGLFLLIVFAVELRVLPAMGIGQKGDTLDYIKHLILPSVALAITWIGYLARLVRTSLLEVMNETYVRSSRAAGLSERLVLYKYALKNALIPTVAVLGVGLGSLMGGAVFVEIIFSRPGMGLLIYNAIQVRNYPLVRSGVLVVAFLFVLANFIADLLYTYLDPRIQLNKKAGLIMQYIEKPSNPIQKTLDRIPVLGDILKQPLGVIGFVIVLLFVISVIFAPLIAPYDYARQDIPNRMQGPTEKYWLGTDHIGRDIFSRLVYGSRIAFGTAIPSVAIALTVGTLLGLIAGYVGGLADNIIVVVMDTLQAFPSIMLSLAILALLGPSLVNVIIVIGITWMPNYARVIRAQTLSIREKAFVESEQSLGATDQSILLSHILPNVIAPALLLAAMDLPWVITFEAGLSFMGMGVRPPTPSWGVILSEGFNHIFESQWPIIWSGVTLALTTLGFTLFGEALRDVLDPRLSGTRGL